MDNGLAFGTDIRETSIAEEDRVFLRVGGFVGLDSVDRGAVGCRAELVFGGMCANVDLEARLQQGFEYGEWEQFSQFINAEQLQCISTSLAG